MWRTHPHNSNIVSCVVDISMLGLPVVDFINLHDEVRIDVFGRETFQKKNFTIFFFDEIWKVFLERNFSQRSYPWTDDGHG